jgi:hypothetical protein
MQDAEPLRRNFFEERFSTDNSPAGAVASAPRIHTSYIRWRLLRISQIEIGCSDSRHMNSGRRPWDWTYMTTMTAAGCSGEQASSSTGKRDAGKALSKPLKLTATLKRRARKKLKGKPPEPDCAS